jgi:hypothetical protein
MSLDRKILERIEREHLSIKPKWFFALKNLVFGAGTISASILGSLSLALLFEIMAEQEKNLTWLSVPYAWAILLGVFLLGGYWLVTKIDSLYKIKFVPIVSMLFFISLSFGYLTFASGKAEKIELALEKMPIYATIMSISKENVIPLDVEEKIKPDNKENNNTEEINDDRNNEANNDDSKSADNNDEDKDIVQESKPNIKIKDEDNDDEIKTPEKTDSVDDEDDDLVEGEVKGVSNEAVEKKAETEEDEEIEEEKADSNDNTISTNDGNFEESESDAMDED